MRTFDLTPLYRSTVGFDRIFDLLDTSGRSEGGGYPPYDIERIDENEYRITLAVAGFGEEELEIELHEQILTVTGSHGDEESGRNFLHRGIARRAFRHRFQLAEHVRVTGASLVNGLLDLELRREVPEAKKPRKVEIGRVRPARKKVLANTGKAA